MFSSRKREIFSNLSSCRVCVFIEFDLKNYRKKNFHTEASSQKKDELDEGDVGGPELN